jgi:putative transposase
VRQVLVSRTEQQQIHKNNSMFLMIDHYCLLAKNLYNETDYIIRQEFFSNKRRIKYREAYDIVKPMTCYSDMGSNNGQQVLRMLDKNWESFMVADKDYEKYPDKYLGKPKPPKYLDKDGRYVFALDNNKIHLMDGYIRFSWKPFKEFIVKTHITQGRLIQMRFIPRGNHYTMETVYEIEVPDIQEESSRICGIDLGINNFATVSNNANLSSFIINGKIIKSFNQYYNKKKATIQSNLKKVNSKDWSNKLEQLLDKRNNKVKDYMHKTSRYIIDWCVLNNIDTIVIGNNNQWKQNSNMKRKTNQQFVTIPYEMFINQVIYKGQSNGIRVICNDESYTSGTSFLDCEEPIKANYNKKRRIKRGMFKSNQGILINADLNGSYQIIKKVFPNAFSNGIEGVSLHPVRINV